MTFKFVDRWEEFRDPINHYIILISILEEIPSFLRDRVINIINSTLDFL